MENFRSIKIIVEINTNKATYKKEFNDEYYCQKDPMDEAKEYYDEIVSSINNP